MLNNTNIKISKKYENMIEEIQKDGDGYWVYAKGGYIFSTTGTNTEHQDTQKKLLEAIRTIEIEECKEKIELNKNNITKDFEISSRKIVEKANKIQDGRKLFMYIYDVANQLSKNEVMCEIIKNNSSYINFTNIKFGDVKKVKLCDLRNILENIIKSIQNSL